jgi:hypothetical protein
MEGANNYLGNEVAVAQKFAYSLKSIRPGVPLRDVVYVRVGRKSLRTVSVYRFYRLSENRMDPSD